MLFKLRRGLHRNIVRLLMVQDWSPVHTTLGEFENGDFTLKMHQMFSVHTTPEVFKNATITGHCALLFK